MEPNHEKPDQFDDDQSREDHPLSNMPDFDAYRERVEHRDFRAQQVQDYSRSDIVLDKIFDKVGRGVREGYFKNPSMLAGLANPAINRTRRQAIDNFRSQIAAFRQTPNAAPYEDEITNLIQQTQENVYELSQKGLVGDDTIKVFLDPERMSSRGGVSFISQYNDIQADYSRKNEKSWSIEVETTKRYQMRAKELADDFALNVGDVHYQTEVSGDTETEYDPNKPFIEGEFIHVNSQKNRINGALRCYISSDKTTDPSAVLYAWKESMDNSPLKNSLYFKFMSTMNPKDIDSQRPDDIVIYKTKNIDDSEFRNLLQDFQERCNAMSPDLLAADDAKMPVATEKIANGISIACDPDYVNDYLKFANHREGKHSWTTFVDHMTALSLSVASNRLDVEPTSLDVPGLENETKKVFREFMLLSKINPDSLLPEEYGNELPSWCNLDEMPIQNYNDTDTENSGAESKETVNDNRELLKQTDDSKLYGAVNPDGSQRITAIESVYMDRSEDFAKSHQDVLKKYPDTHMAMMTSIGLPIDLALVDLTRGNIYYQNDASGQTRLLEDYGILQDKLNSPDVSNEEKQLISEYFETMQSTALQFVDARYNETRRNNNQNPKQYPKSEADVEQGEILERVKANLDTLKEQTEEIKRTFESSDAAASNLQEQIQAALSGRIEDLDDVRKMMHDLHNAKEDLSQVIRMFGRTNNFYATEVTQNQQYMDKTWYDSEQDYMDNNEEAIRRGKVKLATVEEFIERATRRIDDIDETLYFLR